MNATFDVNSFVFRGTRSRAWWRTAKASADHEPILVLAGVLHIQPWLGQ